MLFIFLWFELCKILPENSHNPIILQYKYDKLKEKNAPLIDEENEDTKKKKKNLQTFYIKQFTFCNRDFILVLFRPYFFWFTSKNITKNYFNFDLGLASLIYLFVRNQMFDNWKSKLRKIDVESTNYLDLFTEFHENLVLYGSIDGIVIIIAFFSFIHSLSKVSSILNCYFQMIIKVLFIYFNKLNLL